MLLSQLKPMPKIDYKKVYRVVKFYNISQTTLQKIHKKNNVQIIHYALTSNKYPTLLKRLAKSVLNIANKKYSAGLKIEDLYL